jgi:hypothetical protein
MTLADNIVGYNSTSLLDEADELARNRKWTRDFALYIIFSQAKTAGDKMKAEACMKLLESEVMNALTNSVFLERMENITRISRANYTELYCHSPAALTG